MEGNSSLYIHTLPKLMAIDLRYWICNYFSWSFDLTRPRDFVNIGLYGSIILLSSMLSHWITTRTLTRSKFR